MKIKGNDNFAFCVATKPKQKAIIFYTIKEKKEAMIVVAIWVRHQGKGVARLRTKRKPRSQGKEAARVRTKRKPGNHITYSRECKKV
jgi:hypothetical protein